MAELVQATELQQTETGFTATLDPAWDIWGPAGGYIAALAMRAVGMVAPAGHRPLTQTGQFVSVARAGEIAVTVEPVKQGGSCLYMVSLTQDGKTVFFSQIWTSARADASLPTAPVAPIVPPPADLLSLETLMRERGMQEIAFWQNLEGRPVNLRFAGDPLPDDSRQYRWMRYRNWTPTTDPFVDAMRSVMLIDIGVWPAHWHRLPTRADYMAPSLDLAVHFHSGEPASDWLLSDADTDVSGSGTISGGVRIWSADGRPVATGMGHCLVVAAKQAG